MDRTAPRAGTGPADRRDPVESARVQLLDLAGQLRDDVRRVADPHTRALFGTTADPLEALEEAFAEAETTAEPVVHG